MRVSIQAPGRGSARRAGGHRVSTRKGSGEAEAEAAKTASATPALWVSAKPTAEPMNGAVQGVATSVASTPVKKEPPRPAAPGEPVADPGEPAADMRTRRTG